MKNLLLMLAVTLLIVSWGRLFYIGTRILIGGIKYSSDWGSAVFGLMIMISSLAAFFGMLLLLF